MDLKATLSIEHGECTEKGREAIVKIIGTSSELITLWTVLSMNLAERLQSSPVVLGAMLACTTPQEISKFVSNNFSMDLSHWREK